MLDPLCVPRFLGGPVRICLHVCSFPSTRELPTTPLKSQASGTFLFSPQWHINLNCPKCPRVSFLWNLHIYIWNKFGHFLLSICLSIWLLAQPELKKMGEKLFCTLTQEKWISINAITLTSKQQPQCYHTASLESTKRP